MKLAIQQMRKKMRISQTEFAERIGVSLRTVGSWERGESVPSAEQIWNCAVVLGCSPNEILCWDDERSHEDSGEHLTSEEREIVGCYRESTFERKKSLMQTARDSADMSKEMAKRSVSATKKLKVI